LKFYIAGVENFAYFFPKNGGKYYNFPFVSPTDAADAEIHFLAHYHLFSFVCYQSYTRSRCCFTPNRWAWLLAVTWREMAVTPFDLSWPKNPAIHELDGCSRSHCRLKFYIAGIRNFAYILRKIVILKFPFVPQNWCKRYGNTFSGTLSTVLACMLPELHAVKLLFYAESVGVVTSGH